MEVFLFRVISSLEFSSETEQKNEDNQESSNPKCYPTRKISCYEVEISSTLFLHRIKGNPEWNYTHE